MIIEIDIKTLDPEWDDATFWFNEEGANFVLSTESSATGLEWDRWDCWTEYYDWFAHRVVPAEREVFSYLLQEAYYGTTVKGLDFELINIYYNHGKNTHE